MAVNTFLRSVEQLLLWAVRYINDELKTFINRKAVTNL